MYFSTWLPSGDVRVHVEVFQPLTVGVDRVAGQQKFVYNSFVPLVSAYTASVTYVHAHE